MRTPARLVGRTVTAAHLRSPLSAAIGVLCVTTFVAGACSRTPLGLYGDEVEEDMEMVPSTLDPLPDASDEDATLVPPDPAEPPCVPEEEICNGADDDCDGDVDELKPIPCPGGGSRYCIAGSFSECPTRCERCLPGSERVCFISYCTYWGVEICTSDGRSFGGCNERDAPPECMDVVKKHRNSPELEQCCIDNGYCCVDEHDLDNDGNRTELLGRCEEVECEP